MSDQHLNSAQIQQIERKVLEHVQGLMKNINLRQWAVEQALTHCSRHADFKDLADMFEKIYTFVAKPANAEIKVNVERVGGDYVYSDRAGAPPPQSRSG